VREREREREDGWSWTHSSDGRYLVKSAYSHLLSSLQGPVAPDGVVLEAATRVWKSGAPSKVVVFSWQLILDRIPTRINLSLRGVPLPVGVSSALHRRSRRFTCFFCALLSFWCGIRCLGG